MKLIIDINKEVYKGLIDDTHIFVKPIFDAIKNGIPLDKIRDEIKELSYPYNLDAMRTKSDVLQIINKYKGE